MSTLFADALSLCNLASVGIFGIVLASTLVIIPTSYVGAWEIVLSAVCCSTAIPWYLS